MALLKDQVLAAAVSDDRGGAPWRFFMVDAAALSWTLWEVPDPANLGARAWEARDHGMGLAAKMAFEERVAASLSVRPGFTVDRGSFPVPEGIAVLLAGTPAAAGRALVEAWEAAGRRPAPGGRNGRGGPAASRRKPGSDGGDVTTARPVPGDRLAAFEERALAALESLDSDPEHALSEFAQLRDDHAKMTAALGRAASYLDSLELLISDRFSGPPAEG